jgi:hypothetical protein
MAAKALCRPGQLAATAALGLGIGVAAAGSAAASPIYALRNGATGACLDANSAGVRGYTCNSASLTNGYQGWYLDVTAAPAFRLHNVYTNKCLTALNASVVVMAACGSGSNQLWTNIGFVNNQEQFDNRAYNTCLDDSVAAGLRLYGCLRTSYLNGYQSWAWTSA